MLKLYLGTVGDSGEEAAILIFAHDAQEAKKVAFPVLFSWDTALDYIDVRVRRIKVDAPHLWGAGDPKKIYDGTAHAIDDPPTCMNCETWGAGIVIQDNGSCRRCNDAYEDD